MVTPDPTTRIAKEEEHSMGQPEMDGAALVVNDNGIILSKNIGPCAAEDAGDAARSMRGIVKGSDRLQIVTGEKAMKAIRTGARRL